MFLDILKRVGDYATLFIIILAKKTRKKESRMKILTAGFFKVLMYLFTKFSIRVKKPREKRQQCLVSPNY